MVELTPDTFVVHTTVWCACVITACANDVVCRLCGVITHTSRRRDCIACDCDDDDDVCYVQRTAMTVTIHVMATMSMTMSVLLTIMIAAMLINYVR